VKSEDNRPRTGTNYSRCLAIHLKSAAVPRPEKTNNAPEVRYAFGAEAVGEHNRSMFAGDLSEQGFYPAYLDGQQIESVTPT